MPNRCKYLKLLNNSMTVNQWVAGSSPAWGASIGKGLLIFRLPHTSNVACALTGILQRYYSARKVY